jgi:hypothetical protein
VEMVCGPEHASPWFALDKTARDGSVAFETTYGGMEATKEKRKEDIFIIN